MIKNFSFDDFINDSIRILIIADAVNSIKKIKLTENRIRLYDYYLRFPRTMFNGIATDEELKANIDEYYAFFHWSPDIVKYRKSTNFLIAKGFLVKEMQDNNVVYIISNKGIEAIKKLNSSYKQKLVSLAKLMIKSVLKLNDSKIEEEIKYKTNILSRKNEVIE